MRPASGGGGGEGAQNLLAAGGAATEAGELIKLVLKTFWSATYMYVPAPLAEPQHFAGWMTALHAFVLAPVPTVPPPPFFFPGGHIPPSFI